MIPSLFVRAPPNYERFIFTLRTWQELYLKLTKSSSIVSKSWSWESTQLLIRSAERLDNYARLHLQEALSASDAEFAPLRDPLSLNLGSHRWLSRDREESYSDWLAWILQGISESSDILKLFGVDGKGALDKFGTVTAIRREVRSEYGRTDIEIWSENRGLLLIEVKVQDPGVELPSQLDRYVRLGGREELKCQLLVLLAIEEPEQSIAPFVFIKWESLCKRLRLYAMQIKASDLLRAATIFIFCGAVEQNLLGLSMQPKRFSAMSTVDYLKTWREET